MVFHPLGRAVPLDATPDTCSLSLSHGACQSSLARAQAVAGWIALSHVFHLVQGHRTPRPTCRAATGTGLDESASVAASRPHTAKCVRVSSSPWRQSQGGPIDFQVDGSPPVTPLRPSGLQGIGWNGGAPPLSIKKCQVFFPNLGCDQLS